MPNLFLVGGMGAAPRLQTSPDGTATWNARTFPTTGAVRGLAYSSSLTLFVAVGANGLLATSPDGITWTSGSAPWLTAQMNDVIWVDTLGLFIAVGAGARLYTSPDGTTWTSRTSSFGGETIQAIAWSPSLGRLVITGSAGATGYSSNATSWTVQVTAASALNGVAWSPALSLFVTVGASATVYSSPDGITWTSRASGGLSLNAVTWAPAVGRFVAVGNSGSVYYSSNGTSWNTSSTGGVTSQNSVAWSPALGLFLSAGNVASTVYTSPDGINWTSRATSWTTADDAFRVIWAAPTGTLASGTVTAAAALSATGVVAFARTGSVSAAPALSATRVAAMVRTGDMAAAPVLTAEARIDDGTRDGTIQATPVLTATAVAQLTRTADLTAAATASATQTNQISPQRNANLSAAATLTATAAIIKQTRSGTITAAAAMTGPGIPDVAIPAGPPVVGKVDMRLRAYAPNGASLGFLPAPSAFRCAMPLNDIPALTLTYGVNVPRADILGQPLELAVELTQDGGNTWTEPYDGRFLYLTDGRDPAKTADEWQAEAKGYIWRLTKARVLAEGALNGEGRRELTGAGGAIFGTLWAEAQNRGALSGMTLVGGGATDANGVAWAFPMTRAYDVGQDYLSVLMDLEAVGYLDFRVVGRELRLYVKDTVMATDRTATPAQVSVTPLQVTEAPFRRTWEGLADHITVLGDEGLTASVTNPGALRPWGRWEDFVTAGGVGDLGTLTTVGTRYMDLTADARMEVTNGIALGIGQVPLMDYQVGDYVWSQPSTGAKIKYRVRQVTLEKEGKTVQGNVVLNDRFLESDIRTRRLVDAIISGASAGSTGPLPTPPGPDILQPAAVVSLTGSSSTYPDAGGITWGQVSLDWPDVTTNLDGTPLADLDHYEVQAKKGDSASTAQWQRLADTTESRATLSPYVPGDLWTFRVRAVDSSDNRGPWSPVFTATISSDTTGPVKPSTPTATSRLGTGAVTWDGLAVSGLPMDADFAYAAIHLSVVNGFTWSAANRFSTMLKADTVQVGPLTMGATYYGRLVPYDTSGNAGTPSDQFSFTVAALVDVSNFPDSAMATLYARTAHFITLDADQVTSNGAAIGFLQSGVIQGGIFETTLGGEFRTSSDPSATGGVRVRNSDGFRAYGNKGVGGGPVVQTVSIDPTTGIITATAANLIDANLTGTVTATGSGVTVTLSGLSAPGAVPGLSLSRAAGGNSYLYVDTSTGGLVLYNNVEMTLTAPGVKMPGQLTVADLRYYAQPALGSSASPNMRILADGSVVRTDTSLGAPDSGGSGYRVIRVPN